MARNVALMLADAACVVVCWAISVWSYHVLGGGYEPSSYLRMWPVVPTFLAVNVLFRLYHGRLFYPSAPFSPVEEMRRLMGSALLVHIGVLAALVLMRQTTEGYSRVVIVCSGIMTAVSSQFVRNMVRTILKRIGIGQIPVALVGSVRNARRLARAMAGDAYLGFSPVGCFSNDRKPVNGVPCWGDPQTVVEECRKHGVRILFASEDERLFRCHLREFAEWFTYIEYIPTDAAFPVFGSRAVLFGGLGGLEMVNQDRMLALRLEKWIVDKALALLVFVALSPVMLAIALLVRLTSPGPVLFRHARLGRHGRPIRIWKFRTMYADADVRLKRILSEDLEAEAEWRRTFKLRDDPRVTPLGRFLRKTSLDELPQLFNVLGGSLTLVGPRPIVEQEVPYYGKSYELFSSVKPGITGLWQVSGRSDCGYDERVALDVHYILNWSPWMDLWIVIRTAVSVLKMSGSY